MTKKTSKISVVNVVIYIMIIVLFVGIFGVLFRLTNGFKGDVQFFTVEVGDKVYSKDSTANYEIPSDIDIGFKCVYLLNKKEKGYRYVIRPNEEYDFKYKINGEERSFMDNEDYSECFNITESDNLITINISKYMMMYDIISNLYTEGDEVVLDGDYDTLVKSYFIMSITANDNKTVVNIPIRFKGIIGVESIILDKTEVII